MADQFGERIRLRGQQGFGLDDQVLVARVIELRDKVDRKRPGSRVVVRGRELVDDRGHVRRRVLRCLRCLGNFCRYQHFDANCHVSP